MFLFWFEWFELVFWLLYKFFENLERVALWLGIEQSGCKIVPEVDYGCIER